MKYTTPQVTSTSADGATPRGWCWFGFSCTNVTFTCAKDHQCIGPFSCEGKYKQ